MQARGIAYKKPPSSFDPARCDMQRTWRGDDTPPRPSGAGRDALIERVQDRSINDKRYRVDRRHRAWAGSELE
jgi:hypothetical protein